MPTTVDTPSPNDTKLAGPVKRARAPSLVTVEQVGESAYEVLDQSSYANPNAEWVNSKGLLALFNTTSSLNFAQVLGLCILYWCSLQNSVRIQYPA